MDEADAELAGLLGRVAASGLSAFLFVEEPGSTHAIGRLAEAATFAGRRDELQSLRLGDPEALARRSHPHGRRTHPGVLPHPDHIRSLRLSRADIPGLGAPLGVPGARFAPAGDPSDLPFPTEVRILARTGHAFDLADPLPPLDLSPFAQGKGLLCVAGSRPTEVEYVEWLLVRATEAAERGGCVPPVLLRRGPPLRHLRHSLGWNVPMDWRAGTVCLHASPSALERLDGMPGDGLPVRDRDPSALDRICPVECMGEDRFVVATDGWRIEAQGLGPPGRIRFRRTDPWGWVESWTQECDPEGGTSASARRGLLFAWAGCPEFAPPSTLASGPGETRDDGPTASATPGTLAEQLSDLVLDASTWRWIAADRSPERRRLQFTRTFPALARLGPERDMTAAIDRGDEAVPVLAGRLGLREGVVRRLVGLSRIPAEGHCLHPAPYDLPFQTPPASAEDIGPFLGGFSPDSLPGRGDAAEWAAFSNVWTRLERLSSHLTLNGAPSVPSRILRELAVTLPGRTWEARSRSVQDLGPQGDTGACADTLRSFHGWIRHVWFAAGMEDAVRILADGRSLVGLAEASRAWHANPSLSGGPGWIDPGLSWPAAFAPVRAGDGCEVRVLSSIGAILAEGQPGPDAEGVDGLSHCVGSYAVPAYAGECLLLSVRRIDPPARLSTAELRPHPDGAIRIGPMGHDLRQHQGLGNAEPPEEAEAALRSVLEGLSSGSIAVDPKAFERRDRSGLRKGRRDAQAEHSLWRTVLPRRLGRLDLADFLEALHAVQFRPPAKGLAA
jgi:hypothetical protein